MSRSDQVGPRCLSQSEVSGGLVSAATAPTPPTDLHDGGSGPQHKRRGHLRPIPEGSTMTNAPKRRPVSNIVRRVGVRLSEAEHVVDAVVVLLSTGAGGVGLSMLWVPEAYGVPSFRKALELFPPHVWGGALFAIAACTLVALRGDRLTLAATLGGQVIIWAVWGICLIRGVREGVPSGAIIYTCLTWVCFVLATYYWQTRDRTTTHAP